VNEFVADEQTPIGTLYIDESAEERQLAGLERLRGTRDNARVHTCLAALKGGAQGTANTMPLLVDAVRAYATVGEMCDALREVWGEYEETPII
jgi:methylmalonyl-CoA mutase N-terminal domain/subunit